MTIKSRRATATATNKNASNWNVSLASKLCVSMAFAHRSIVIEFYNAVQSIIFGTTNSTKRSQIRPMNRFATDRMGEKVIWIGMSQTGQQLLSCSLKIASHLKRRAGNQYIWKKIVRNWVSIELLSQLQLQLHIYEFHDKWHCTNAWIDILIHAHIFGNNSE